MVEYDDAPPSGRRGGSLVATVIAYLVLLLSIVLCVFVVSKGLEFSTKETCGPNPPTHERQIVVALTALFYLPCAALTVFFLEKKKTDYVIFGVIVSFAALFEPLVGLFAMAFMIGMC